MMASVLELSGAKSFCAQPHCSLVKGRSTRGSSTIPVSSRRQECLGFSGSYSLAKISSNHRRPVAQASRSAQTRCSSSVAENETDEPLTIGPDTRVPVTILTGFLGAGKTTALNYILRADHGRRIAVIENEYGEVDIDGSLIAAEHSLVGAEDVIMLNNGCLCCTVRGDLVRMIGQLVRTRRDKFDHIIIETTGLANPAPVIQTFFLEDEILEDARLDGVVTLVDAKHAHLHLDEVKEEGVVNECVEQIAFADRIIINKVDLVEEEELQEIVDRVKGINMMAHLQTASFGKVDLDYILGIGGFDLERIESEVAPAFLNSASNDHDHHHHHDHEHEHGHDEEGHSCGTCGGDHSSAEHEHHAHEHEHDHGHDHHHHGHSHDHHHDPGVSSVSIVCEGSLDLEKINDWLGNLLNEKSDDIYRMKGVLSIHKCRERYVFQGVHALFEGSPDRPWGSDETRNNKIVFIGKGLNKEELESGFKECLV